MFQPTGTLVANAELEVSSKSMRTRFLIGGVKVLVSWWSNDHDACLDSERLGFNFLLKQ